MSTIVRSEKIQNEYDASVEDKEMRRKHLKRRIMLFILLAVLIFIIVLIIKNRRDKAAREKEPEAGFVDADTALAEEFSKYEFMAKTGVGCISPFTTTDEFKYITMTGKEELLKKCTNDILRISKWISSLTQEKLHKIIIPANMAFLLNGPPGTGKTLFVQNLARVADISLREMYIAEKTTPAFLAELGKRGIYNKVIDAMASRVRYAYITPSRIKNAFIGGTERTIRNLFENARKMADGYLVASIIMFDEADAFFSDRGDQYSNHERSSSNEFLTHIAATPTTFKSTFVFAATNYASRFDEAFTRRFGRHVEFEMPNAAERMQLIMAIMEDRLDLATVKRIVSKTRGCSHAYITRHLKGHCQLDMNGDYESFDEEGFLATVAADRLKGKLN